MRIDRKLSREESGFESVESVQQCQGRDLAIWPVIPSYKVRAMQQNCAGTPCADSPVCPVPLTVWNNTPASGPRLDNLHSVLWALCPLTEFDGTIISIQIIQSKVLLPVIPPFAGQYQNAT